MSLFAGIWRMTGWMTSFVLESVHDHIAVHERSSKVYAKASIWQLSAMAIDKPSDSLPLAEVLRAANALVAAGLIEDWALGGALAAIYYVEPFTTYDADIFFIPKDRGLTAGIPGIHAHLQSQGWHVEGERLIIRGFPVLFLAAAGLTEEAVREAERFDYEGVPARAFRAEHIVAIAAGVGRAKDKARIEQLFQQANLDQSRLENIMQRHNLKLPKP